MTQQPADIRIAEFRARPVPWIIVHHLLTAELVRELAIAIVDVGSCGRLALADLVDELSPAGDSALSSWSIVTRGTSDPLADFLTRYVTTMVWRGDDPASWTHEKFDTEEAAWIGVLDGAFRISSADLGSPWRLDDERLSPASLAMAQARAAAASESDVDLGFLDAVRKIGEGGAPLLSALLTKHFGDLLADADRWDLAKACYLDAAVRLSNPNDDWREATEATADVTDQCVAMAEWHLNGPAAAAALLERLVSRRSIDAAPLPALNAEFELMNARFAQDTFSTAWPDTRSATYAAPLLLSSHHLDNAVTHSATGKFRDAHRWFWATLRRQTALGGTKESWTTKGHYGRSIINEVQSSLGRDLRPDAFGLGIRLLVESGRTDLAESTAWDESLVEAYVDLTVNETLRAIPRRSPGTASARSMVATVLRREWLIAMPRDREELARELLADLAAAAREGAHTGMSNTNTGGLALKALRQVGARRPDFSSLVGDELVPLMDDVVANRASITVSEVIEAAAEFVVGMDPRTSRALLDRTIDVVDRLPDDAFWPVTHAAHRLLGSDAAVRISREDADFGRRRSNALIKLALNAKSENASLLYLIEEVDPAEVSQHLDAAGMTRVIDSVRQRALETSSSAATANIHALLTAPRMAGEEGVMDALTGLKEILCSAIRERTSPSLYNGYEAVLLLARTGDRIADALGDQSAFLERARKLREPLADLWRAAAARPRVFAGFAIPPQTHPHRATVHNWTLATLEFAHWLGTPDALEKPLATAFEEEALREGMSTARAMHSTRSGRVEAEVVKTERADAFYAALGERLARLDSLDGTDAVSAIRVLLDRAIALGPRGEDAALLVAARRLEQRLGSDDPAVLAYSAKLRSDPKLRLSLSPLLNGVLADAPLRKID